MTASDHKAMLLEEYMSRTLEAREEGDNNFCVPMVYALLTGVTVAEASKVLGRQKGKGHSVLPLMDALEKRAGFKCRIKDVGGMTRNMPKKRPKGKYILVSNNHVALMHDGVVADWTGFEGNTNKRIKCIIEVA